MFCPVCKTKYRPGFTKCADCGVDLVATLPADDPAEAAEVGDDAPTDSDGRILLWSGLSAQVGNALCEALDSASIPHKDTDREFGLVSTTGGAAWFVWIDPRDRPAARSILNEILVDPAVRDQDDNQIAADESRVNPLFPARRALKHPPVEQLPDPEDALAESEDSGEPTPDDIVEDFDPDDAIAQIWSGDDKDMADYLKLCLGGVGVGCVIHEDAGKFHVSVLPAQEERAREIVYEILEGTPPQ
jgi:hypothetical protein